MTARIPNNVKQKDGIRSTGRIKGLSCGVSYSCNPQPDSNLYIRLFVSWTVRNRNQIQKQRDRQRKTQYEQHQQYSKHTCVVYSISNDQFTELSPVTTQSFKFIQHCIFYFTFNIITSKITNIHVTLMNHVSYIILHET